MIVGSEGELWKCWDDVGNAAEAIGHIRDYRDTNGRLHRWLSYDPFANDECRSCIALPACMGGCAHHAMVPNQYENRCGSFRHTHRETVERLADLHEADGACDHRRPELQLLARTGPAPAPAAASPAPVPTPVRLVSRAEREIRRVLVGS